MCLGAILRTRKASLMGSTPKLLYQLRRFNLLSISSSFTRLRNNSKYPNFPSPSNPNLPSSSTGGFSTLLNPNSFVFPNYISFRAFSCLDSTENRRIEGCNIVEGSGTESEFSNPGLDVSVAAEDGISGDGWSAVIDEFISSLDGFHDLTNLPWWVVITTSTLTLRMALLPVIILQLKKMKKFSELLPKMPPLLPPPFSGRSFLEQFLLFRKEKRAIGCPSYLWTFASFVVQAPCFIIWLTSIRRMSLDHHPGFDCGGVLWFQDLTDFPHGALGSIFPILIAGLHVVNVQISFRTIKDGNLPGVFGILAKCYKLYLDVLTIPILLIGFSVPQGSLVYWLTNSSLTVVQQLSLKHPYICKKLGLDGKNVPLEHKVSTENLSPNEQLELAFQHIAKGQEDRALPLLRLATERDPHLVGALIATGQILCSRGLLVEGGQYFERAISKTKDDEVSLMILASFCAGVSLILQGNNLEGIEHLKRIAHLEEPENPLDKTRYFEGLVMLGSTLLKEGKNAEAAKYLRRAAAHDPSVNVYIEECVRAENQ